MADVASGGDDRPRVAAPDRLACATPDVVPALMIAWLVGSAALGVMIALAARGL